MMNEHLELSNIIKGYHENKTRLISIISAIFLIFTIYAFSIPNTYKAEIYLVPPQDKYVQPLNYFATQIAKDSQLILEQKFIYFGFMKMNYIIIFLVKIKSKFLKKISMITLGLGWNQNLFLEILGKKIF